jgi:hypothetical protein
VVLRIPPHEFRAIANSEGPSGNRALPNALGCFLTFPTLAQNGLSVGGWKKLFRSGLQLLGICIPRLERSLGHLDLGQGRATREYSDG